MNKNWKTRKQIHPLTWLKPRNCKLNTRFLKSLQIVNLIPDSWKVFVSCLFLKHMTNKKRKTKLPTLVFYMDFLHFHKFYCRFHQEKRTKYLFQTHQFLEIHWPYNLSIKTYLKLDYNFQSSIMLEMVEPIAHSLKSNSYQSDSFFPKSQLHKNKSSCQRYRNMFLRSDKFPAHNHPGRL